MDDAGVSNNILCQGRAVPPEICLGSDVQRKILVHRCPHVIQILKVGFPIVYKYAIRLIKFNEKFMKSSLHAFQFANFSTSASRARPGGMDAASEMSLTLCLCHTKGKDFTHKPHKNYCRNYFRQDSRWALW
jgi:hypothetical protein